MTRLNARAASAALAAAALLALAACGPTGTESTAVEPTAPGAYPESTSYPDIPVAADIPYGTADGQPLLLDTCLPAEPVEEASPRAAIVVIHGGSWQHGDKSNINWRSVCQWFASEGFVAVSVNYRLVPAATFPAQLDDVQAAVRWLRDDSQVERYNIDPDRIGAFGGSAGGNLAVEAAIATGRPAVSWSGIFDLRHIIESTESAATDPEAAPMTQDLDALKSADIDQTGPDVPFLRWTILQEVGGDRSLLEAASTTRHVVAGSGPVYLVNSMHEFVPVDDPAALQRAFAAVGVASTLQLVPGVHHAEGYTDQAIGGSLQFLADALRRD